MQIEIQPLPNSLLEQLPQNILTGMLLSGDRISCCQYAAIATDGDKLVGICTIATHGEQNSGRPTIVGLYVLREYRRQSLAIRLLIESIKFMERHRYLPIHIDVMSSNLDRLIQKLPDRLKSHLVLINHHGILDMWQQM